MATVSPTHEAPRAASAGAAPLLVSLPSLPQDALDSTLAHLAEAVEANGALPLAVLAATPDREPGEPAAAYPGGSLQLTGYAPAASAGSDWTLGAADYLNSYELVRQHGAAGVLVLGPECQSLSATALRALLEAAAEAEMAVPRYLLPPRSGLVNSAILYPLTRALFGTQARFPLPVDLVLSARMAERMATQAQRATAAGQNDALLWPVAEAAMAGVAPVEVPGIERITPQPAMADLTMLLSRVAGSLFSDIEQKAVFWQRARAYAPSVPEPAAPATGEEDFAGLVETFRLAYGNLQEIWSLVLPPQSLVGLKRMASMPIDTFTMPDALWARIVYDFVLAHRLRTINRGHLLGALTPLYLAWVASHIRLTSGGMPQEKHIQATATAFEADKAYLVSRWRWPDRFNP